MAIPATLTEDVFRRTSSFLLGSLCAFAFGYTLGLFDPTPEQAAPSPIADERPVRAVGRPGAVERPDEVPSQPPAEPPPPVKRRVRTRKRASSPPPVRKKTTPQPEKKKRPASPVAPLRRKLAALDPNDAGGRHELMRAITKAAAPLPAEARASVEACIAKAGMTMNGETAKQRLATCVGKLAKHL